VRGATGIDLNLFGAAPVIGNSTSFNSFERINVAMTGGNSTGISIDGVGGAFYNIFTHAQIILTNAAGTNYGLALGFCDTNIFIMVHWASGGAGSNSILLDYTRNSAFPNSNGFFACDTSGKPVAELNPGIAPV